MVMHSGLLLKSNLDFLHMKKILFLSIIGIALLGFNSCEMLDNLDDYKSNDPGATNTVKLSGEYYVTLDMFDGTNWQIDTYNQGYVKVMVYNTASNRSDSVWFDDLKFWPMKSKISCKSETAEFTACVAPNLYKAAAVVTIVGGKVLTNATKTAAGNVSDSIVVELGWADDAGTQYRYAGYRRTGFLEDEH